MKRLYIVVENMKPVEFIKKGNAFLPDIESLRKQKRQIERIETYNHFAPIEEVIKLTDFITINTELDYRTRMLICGAMREAIYRKDRIVVPLCYFDEDRFLVI